MLCGLVLCIVLFQVSGERDHTRRPSVATKLRPLGVSPSLAQLFCSFNCRRTTSVSLYDTCFTTCRGNETERYNVSVDSSRLTDVMEVPPSGQEEVKEESLPLVVGVGHCDSAPLLWRMEDLRAVRSQGLVGALLGSLPRTPRQNGRLGRPLLLLPEEERLLMESHGAAADTARPQDVSDAAQQQQVALYEEQQQKSFEEQRVLALQDRKLALSRAWSSAHTDPESGDETVDEELRGRLEALDHSFSFPRSALAVQLSTARAGLSYCPEARAFLQAAGPHLDRPHRDAKYQVFNNLRGRGFYLTSAGKFGGDFLVYPGDPLRFHAHFIAICLRLDESVCLLDILAAARLGSNVKKTVLLCSPEDSGGVVYTSLQWSGMA